MTRRPHYDALPRLCSPTLVLLWDLLVAGSIATTGALAYDKFVDQPRIQAVETARAEIAKQHASALEAFIRCANWQPEFLTIAGLEKKPVGIVCYRIEGVR